MIQPANVSDQFERIVSQTGEGNILDWWNEFIEYLRDLNDEGSAPRLSPQEFDFLQQAVEMFYSGCYSQPYAANLFDWFVDFEERPDVVSALESFLQLAGSEALGLQ